MCGEAIATISFSAVVNKPVVNNVKHIFSVACKLQGINTATSNKLIELR